MVNLQEQCTAVVQIFRSLNGGLSLFSAGGHLFDSQLLIDAIGFDPLPCLRIIYAELANACQALGEAVRLAGSKQAYSSF